MIQMKLTIISLFLIVANNSIFSQNRYSQYSQSEYARPAPLPYNELNTALKYKQEQYDAAYNFTMSLLEKIVNIKSGDTDEILFREVDEDKEYLIQLMLTQDLGSYSNELRTVSNKINESVDAYTVRKKKNEAKTNSANSLKKIEGLLREKKFSEALFIIEHEWNGDSNISPYQFYFYKSICNYNLKNYSISIRDLTTATESKFYGNENEKLNLLEWRCQSYHENKQFQEAIQDANTIISISHDPQAYLLKGVSLSEIKSYDEAIKNYDEAIALYPNASMLYNNRGYNKFVSGKDIGDALKDVNKSIELDVENVYALSSRAEINMKLGKYSLAVLDLDKGIKNAPTKGFNYTLRGKCYQKLGNKTGACADWKKAWELNESEGYDLIGKYCN